MTEPRLGRVQFRIMEILWRMGRATAREITDALNDKHDPIAHSTVQTLLRKLEVKEAVTHDMADRTFVFRPLVQPDRARGTATRELIDRVFGGSPGGLVAYLLRHERIPQEELDRIRALIEDSEQESGQHKETGKGEEG